MVKVKGFYMSLMRTYVFTDKKQFYLIKMVLRQFFYAF